MAKRRKSDDDAPEMGREFFERAERVANGEAALLAAMRKTRGRQKAPTKRLVRASPHSFRTGTLGQHPTDRIPPDS